MDNLNLIECKGTILRFGYNKESNKAIDLFCFEHPDYWKYEGDDVLDNLFPENKTKFITFEIHNN